MLALGDGLTPRDPNCRAVGMDTCLGRVRRQTADLSAKTDR